jgi:hypothetical protein
MHPGECSGKRRLFVRRHLTGPWRNSDKCLRITVERRICVSQLTSSQSPEGDGIPTLASRVSCFIGSCLILRRISRRVLHCLHRHITFRKPCGSFSVLSSISELGSRPLAKKESVYVGQHASVFTHGNALPWNLQALFHCQGTRTSILHSRGLVKRKSACGRHSFLPPQQCGWVSRMEFL